jgi:hypothetical protein
VSDAFEHNPGDHEDPLAGPTWLIGALGVLTLVIILMVLTAIYYNTKAEEVKENFITPVREDVVAMKTRQEALLHEPAGWVERQEGGETVRAYVIPIERAMELVVQDANKGANKTGGRQP